MDQMVSKKQDITKLDRLSMGNIPKLELN